MTRAEGWVPISAERDPNVRARRMRTVERRLRERRVALTDQEPCAGCGGGNPLLGCEDRDVCTCGSNWGDELAARCERNATEAWRKQQAQVLARYDALRQPAPHDPRDDWHDR